ncbi:MAG TPA: HAD-IA family hydrolase [Fimbriimonas sp.]|nr:HAD-IA family hydrolase [Fimbriimonas sp.]
MKQNKVVCFDIGGVLLRISHSWDAAADEAGLSLDIPEEKRPLYACGAMYTYQEGALSDEEYLQALATWMNTDPDTAHLLHGGILRREYAGAEELVRRIKQAGVWTCCFSNTNALHWPVITDATRNTAIGMLDAQFASHDVAAAKPDVEAYRLVQKLMPEGAEVIFFDDSQENVNGARSAGWEAFRVDPSGDPIEEMTRILADFGLFSTSG